MKEYIVIKEILNVRDKPVMDDSSFVSELYNGDIIYLHDELIPGDQPAGAETNLWRRDHFERVVHKEGVRELSWPEKKEQIVKAIKNVAGTSGISIAVVDTGVHDNIIYLQNPVTHFVVTKGVITAGIQLVDDIHGSAMSVIIAGVNTVPDPVLGILPAATLVDYKVLDPLPHAVAANLLATFRAIEQMAEIKVINLSFELETTLVTATEMQQITVALKNLISKGKIIIAATGNETCNGNVSRRDIQFPGMLSEVITVGILANGVPVTFNNCINALQLSRQPDCFLELDDWTLCNSTTSTRLSTTLRSSEATAFLSGLIAVKKSQHPEMTQEAARTLIRNSISDTVQAGTLMIRKLNVAAFLRQTP